MVRDFDSRCPSAANVCYTKKNNTTLSSVYYNTMTISGAHIINDMLMNGSSTFTSLEMQVVVNIRYHALLFVEILQSIAIQRGLKQL